MGKTGFDMDEDPAILQGIQTLYEKPSLGKLDAALLWLNDNMDRNQPLELMIWSIKEIQPFLLSYTEDNISLPDTALINYAMVKIKKKRIYPKALARWNAKAITNHIVWANFRNHMIVEYKNFLDEGGRKTLSKEGYGTVFHTTEETDDNA